MANACCFLTFYMLSLATALTFSCLVLFEAPNLGVLAQLKTIEATADTTEGLFFFFFFTIPLLTSTIKYKHWKDPWGSCHE